MKISVSKISSRTLQIAGATVTGLFISTFLIAEGVADVAKEEKKAESSSQDTQVSAPVSDQLINPLMYRANLRARHQKKINDYIVQYQPYLHREKVTFRYFLSPNGVITNVKQVRGNKKSLFSILVHRSLLETNSATIAFPKAMKQKYPSGLFDEATFKSY